MKHALALLAFTAIAIGAGRAIAYANSPPVPEVEILTSIDHFQMDDDDFIGQRLTVTCPPISTRGVDPVYGSSLYSSDSPICMAALHAGAMTIDGGTVSLQVMPGADAYSGTVQNDVTSLDRPATARAIAFPETSSSDTDAVRDAFRPRIDWDTKFTRTGLADRRLVGQAFTFDCPPAPSDMISRRVVGTDRYAFDSMICRSAVHAGQISLEGGPVFLRMEPAATNLVGSVRNGIETQSGSSGIRSLVFIEE